MKTVILIFVLTMTTLSFASGITEDCNDCGAGTADNYYITSIVDQTTAESSATGQ